MLSVLNLMILCPDVDSVEDFAYLGTVGANPADSSMNFPSVPFWELVKLGYN